MAIQNRCGMLAVLYRIDLRLKSNAIALVGFQYCLNLVAIAFLFLECNATICKLSHCTLHKILRN